MKHHCPSLTELFGALKIFKVRFHCALAGPGSLPGYLGSSWRGLLGLSLRRVICPFPDQPTCGQCLIRQHCPYFCLYEEVGELPGAKNNPRPYVLSPEISKNGSEQLTLGLEITLFGEAAGYLPVIWKSAYEASRIGLGVERIPFHILRWEEGHPDGWGEVPNSSDGYQFVAEPKNLTEWLVPARDFPWRFAFTTPLRLRRQGRYLSRMDWPFYLSSVAKRLESLMVTFQGGSPMGREAWMALNKVFQEPAKVSESLSWKDWERYSNRQKRKVPMGGLVGQVSVHEAKEAWWPWLQAAGLVHVGKGASMGLGRLRFSQ